MIKKLNVGVLFGGRSGEHEVSLVSASSIMGALDAEQFNVVPIGIAKDGRFYSGENVIHDLKAGKNLSSEHEVVFLTDPAKKGLLNIKSGKLTPLDVVFPVLHGTFGEDGTVQGLLELTGIPYVGAGVLGSSIGMDKIVQKDVARAAGINVTPSVWFLGKDFASAEDAIVANIEKNLSYPCFVKPSNSGSSVGISKAHNQKELKNSIRDAMRYDRRILVEKAVEGAHEIEVSVLGNDEPCASSVGEVVPSNEFYDYDAKYVDGRSKTLIPADIPEKLAKEVQETAIKAYKAIDCCGMARVDFLVTKEKVYFNEVNTIPGFTSISMYPKLWEASGISYKKLLDDLMGLAIERFEERSKFLTSYQPKKDWYK